MKDSVNYISNALNTPEILCQLTEEAAELTHAAMKLRRVITGNNPTPIRLKDAQENIEEELADVIACFHILEAKGTINTHKLALIEGQKLERWAERLKEKS